jgi:hypothetical protein
MEGHMARGKLKGGFEYDCLCRRYVRLFTWPPRVRKAAKRKFSKRMRKEAKLQTKQEAKQSV